MADFMQEGGIGWTLINARIHRWEGKDLYEVNPSLSIQLNVNTGALIDIVGNPRHIGRSDLQQLIKRRKDAGFDTAAHRLELHQRLGYPLSLLWMLFMTVPWVIAPNRSQSMASNLGVGVIAIGIILSLTQIFRFLAIGHRIDPVVGAWSVSIICLFLTPISWFSRRKLAQR